MIFSFGVFCFLWDDPLFGSDPVEPWEMNDAELITARREVRLKTLEALFEALEYWKEQACRGAWMWQRVIGHVPTTIAEQVRIDAAVYKDIDPDFTFVEGVKADANAE